MPGPDWPGIKISFGNRSRSTKTPAKHVIARSESDEAISMFPAKSAFFPLNIEIASLRSQ